MQQHQNTAVLVFTRTAAEEATHKNYGRCRSFVSGVAVAQQLIQHTVSEAQATGLPVFIVSSAQQRGATFGNRFANAIDDLLCKGYQKVIAVGTDAPELSGRHIKDVALLLEHNDYVSGPSADGGVYIIGISHNIFDKTQLAKIPWHTTAVHDELAEYARRKGCTQAEIEVVCDIDDEYDLLSWISTSDSRLSYKLRALLTEVHYLVLKPDKGVFKTLLYGTYQRRGPPHPVHISA